MKIHNVCHISRLQPFVSSDLPRFLTPPPPPVEIEGEEVEQVLDSRRNKDGTVDYFVSWLGWHQQTWEPFIHLRHALDLVNDFHRRHPRKPRAPSL
ncbi:hypothetical protein V1509DRAFT_636682 [Lipomyces kononenkoae]